MTYAEAIYTWAAKARIILGTRLRSRVAASSAFPDGWADRLVVTIGRDSQGTPDGASPSTVLPAVDIYPVASGCEDRVGSRSTTVQWAVAATVSVDREVAPSVVGIVAAALADEAAELLATWGRGPTDTGECSMVQVVASALPSEGSASLAPETYRAIATLSTTHTTPSTYAHTYVPQAAVPTRDEVPDAGTVTVGGEDASVNRATSLAAVSGPVSLDLSAVYEWASGTVASVATTGPGASALYSVTLTDGVGSVPTSPAAGHVWTITAIDATDGHMIALTIDWTA